MENEEHNPSSPAEYGDEHARDLIKRLGSAENSMRSLIAETGPDSPAHDVLAVLQQAGRALQSIETRYLRLAWRMPVLMFELDPQGTTLFVNEAVFAITGYRASDLAGLNWWDSLFAADQRRNAGELRTILQSRDVSNYETEMTAKGGWKITVAVTSTNVYRRDGSLSRIMGFGVDVTRCKRVEAALAELDSKYANLFENVNDAILVFEPATEIILDANKNACEAYGFNTGELTGLSMKSLTRDPEQCESQIERLLAEGRCENFETVYARKDGTPIDILASCSVIEHGGCKAILSANRDITELKQAHQGLLHADKLAGLGQLVSGVAHELNNPLSSVIGYTQLILESNGIDEVVRERLEIVNREADRTRRIVQNLLSFTRHNGPTRKNVDINAALARTLELRAYEMRVHGIDVHLDLGEIPPVVADEHQLQQVFVNIIVNAEYAMLSNRRGVLKIKTETKHRDGAEWVQVTIADKGPGIPPETLKKVFDAFFTTKPAGEGTGLGLSISAGIIGEHGGTIGVESKLGAGMVFTIDLPRTGTNGESR
ncbi:MAG TPA: PAS domain S-box protein [Blastocatellia bacterium]|nr:PAS domain S-box protein [Blastocatellia bacterium]